MNAVDALPQRFLSCGKTTRDKVPIRQNLKTAFFLFSLGTLVGCSSGAEPEKKIQGETLVSIDCSEWGAFFVDEDATCGQIRRQGSREHLVAYVVLPATGAEEKEEPVVALIGGPGPSGVLLGSSNFAQDGSLGFMRSGRDVIVVDYRGVGMSEPFIGCDEDPQACADAVSEAGVDWADLQTTNFASDVDALLEALGHEKAVLWGGSYGTDVALTIAREHPVRVAAMIIDGVFPPEVNGFSQGAVAPLAALAQIVDGCEQDSDCNEQFGNLRSQIESLPDKLDAEQFGVLAQLGFHPAAPLLVERLATLDQEEALNLLEPLADVSWVDVVETEPPSFPSEVSRRAESFAMSLGVVCSEEASFIDEQPLDADAYGWSEELAELLQRVPGGAPFPPEEAKQVCNAVGASQAARIVTEPVRHAAPTLVLSGGRDMQTSFVG